MQRIVLGSSAPGPAGASSQALVTEMQSLVLGTLQNARINERTGPMKIEGKHCLIFVGATRFIPLLNRLAPSLLERKLNEH